MPSILVAEPVLPQEFVLPAGCLSVMTELEMYTGDLPAEHGTNTTESVLVIEDNRKEPVICRSITLLLAGLWKPHVELGEYVAAGATLGIISSVTGREETEVKANQTGMVLVLRTFCRVAQEEFLAVILEPQSEEDRQIMQEISTHQPQFMHSVSLKQLID
ncbi:MAG: hypothetical protein R3C11_07620 [Planctomycetaceae bacterium]